MNFKIHFSSIVKGIAIIDNDVPKYFTGDIEQFIHMHYKCCYLILLFQIYDKKMSVHCHLLSEK